MTPGQFILGVLLGVAYFLLAAAIWWAFALVLCAGRRRAARRRVTFRDVVAHGEVLGTIQIKGRISQQQADLIRDVFRDEWLRRYGAALADLPRPHARPECVAPFGYRGDSIPGETLPGEVASGSGS